MIDVDLDRNVTDHLNTTERPSRRTGDRSQPLRIRLRTPFHFSRRLEATVRLSGTASGGQRGKQSTVCDQAFFFGKKRFKFTSGHI